MTIAELGRYNVASPIPLSQKKYTYDSLLNDGMMMRKRLLLERRYLLTTLEYAALANRSAIHMRSTTPFRTCCR
jgi:hypothetical protein